MAYMTALISFTRWVACILFCPVAHASGVVSVSMSPRVVCKLYATAREQR